MVENCDMAVWSEVCTKITYYGLSFRCFFFLLPVVEKLLQLEKELMVKFGTT